MVVSDPTRGVAGRVPVNAVRCLQRSALVALLLGAAACASHESAALTAEPVATIDLAVTAVTIAPQQTLTVTATPRDAAGDTSPAGPLHGHPAQPSVATIDSKGVATGIASGMTTPDGEH